jgi:hypothetical protein
VCRHRVFQSSRVTMLRTLFVLLLVISNAQANNPGCVQGSQSDATGNVLGNRGGAHADATGTGASGGGGATEAGGSNVGNCGGKGGAGYTSTISGVAMVYGSGGAGGSRTTGCSGPAGNGAGQASTGVGGFAQFNRGGGGGGGGTTSSSGSNNGGSGAEGVVIVGYRHTDALSISADGGTVLHTGHPAFPGQGALWRSHRFLSGSSSLHVTRAGYCDILIVGGGGDGGGANGWSAGGGGGGGQVIELRKYRLVVGSYTVVVGERTPFGGSASASSFATIRAIGGGVGSRAMALAQAGGSGGGACGGGGACAPAGAALAPSVDYVPEMFLSYVSQTLGYAAVAKCECARGYTGSACSACVAGKYKNSTGSGACTDCGAGKYLTATAASVCTNCGAGKYSTATGASVESACTYCGAGKYLISTGAVSEVSCMLCAVHTYSTAIGATAISTCVNCNANSQAPVGSTAQTSCVCNIGFTGLNGGTCMACDAGKYKSGTGSGACSYCQANSYAPVASMSAEACQCNAGYTGNACTACPAGKYKSGTGNGICLDCGANAYSMVAGSSACKPPLEFATSGRVDEPHSCAVRCVDGFFRLSSSHNCTLHSTPTCTAGEFVRAGTHNRDAACQPCSGCAGRRKLTSCNTTADDACADCGPLPNIRTQKWVSQDAVECVLTCLHG